LFATDGELTLSQLSGKAKELGLPNIAVARRISVVAAIPLLGTGKTDYVKLSSSVATV